MIPDGHRFSWTRLLAALGVVAVVAGGVVGVREWQTHAAAWKDDGPTSWFAGYVDVTATPEYAFEAPVSESAEDVVLSFVVADATKACTPTWGGYYDLDSAASQIDLDRRVALLRERGGEPVVSFGGLANDELATSCTDDDQLLEAYRAVVERYDLRTIDLDVEDDDLTDRAAGVRRARALATLQDERRRAGEPLDVWLTLPAATAGLTEDGLAVVRDTLAGGVELAGVNAMTMNYGGSRDAGESMTDATRRTLEAVHDQLGDLLDDAGADVSGDDVWARIGMTPMIGQNDVSTDVVTLDDARELAALGEELGVGRVSMWSLNRDRACGVNYADTSVVSSACSGVTQDGELFADVLAAGATSEPGAGTPTPAATASSSPTPTAEVTDDPKTSPYRIWSPDASYQQGTKVVWHRQVFEAKWWTSGDVPDDPVATADQTPWQLLGPVLPGDKPAPKPTLPAGTYPEWTSDRVFEAGDRVLVDGVPYRAKWWTQADHPQVSETNPDASPWVQLTDDEVRAVQRD